MTRGDAEEIVNRLVVRGREQAEEILAQLEKEGQTLVPAHRNAIPGQRRQLDLFRPPSERLLAELEDMDPDTVSPVDALLQLRELRERYRS